MSISTARRIVANPTPQTLALCRLAWFALKSASGRPARQTVLNQGRAA